MNTISIHLSATNELLATIEISSEPGYYDVHDCPVTLWASDNGYSVDELSVEGGKWS